MAAPMERQQEGKEEEEEEDWVLDSLGLYEDLHVFDLQEPTRVLEWTRGPSICVAGYGGSGGDGRSEILQLGLPPRLCAREKQGLCPERDFKVERGGFSRRPVHGLKQVPDTGLLVTSGPPDSSLQVWQMAAEDTDVIHFVSTIPAGNASEKSWAKIATAFAGNPWVLHGSRVSNVQVTEIESKRSIYKAASNNSDEVGGLEFLDCNTFLVCSTKGRLSLADIRQPPSPLEGAPVSSALGGDRWPRAKSLCLGRTQSSWVSPGLQPWRDALLFQALTGPFTSMTRRPGMTPAGKQPHCLFTKDMLSVEQAVGPWSRCTRGIRGNQGLCYRQPAMAPFTFGIGWILAAVDTRSPRTSLPFL
ncbi:WD repeat-containing protein 73 isoform A [Alligator mississippiensis]|uniref:WD repeat-containing protein 73 isoform A n=1 Tax=Alligator mississippiensis TaxID=8496 RepID=A0A151NLT9_ALLMI|nr:WD repeat-containing protein 73 isoform A [Alligator mississippiensis]